MGLQRRFSGDLTRPVSLRTRFSGLEQTFMGRRLLPWKANLGKRLVKTPKIYFRDSVIFHALSSIGSPYELLTHPQAWSVMGGLRDQRNLVLAPNGRGIFLSGPQ